MLSVVPGENIAIARRALEAFAAGDVDAFGACCDAQIEIQPAITVLELTGLRGPDAPRRFIETVQEAWDFGEGAIERLSGSSIAIE